MTQTKATQAELLEAENSLAAALNMAVEMFDAIGAGHSYDTIDYYARRTAISKARRFAAPLDHDFDACPDCGDPTENGRQCAGCRSAEAVRR